MASTLSAILGIPTAKSSSQLGRLALSVMDPKTCALNLWAGADYDHGLLRAMVHLSARLYLRSRNAESFSLERIPCYLRTALTVYRSCVEIPAELLHPMI